MNAIAVRGLARSSAYMNAAQFWQMAARLVVTPVAITAIGLERYAAWTLVFGLSSYAVVLDSGAGWAYAKVTAELDARRDYTTLSRVISSGAVFITALSMLLSAILLVVHAPVLHALGVPAPLLDETRRTLLVLSCVVVFEAGAGCVLDVLAGLQRMDLQYRFIIFGATVEFVTTLALLKLGSGMVALPLGLFAGGLVSITAAWLQCRRLCPALKLSPRHATLDGVRHIARLGLRFQSLVLLNTAVAQGIRFTISALYGLNILAIFHLADRVLYVAGSPGIAVIGPLMPAFARFQSYRWQRPFFHASKAVAIAGALPLLFAAVFAAPILFAWTGTRFPEAAWTVRALAPAEFAALLMGVAAARLRAAGTVRLELIAGLLGGALALVGLIVAYPLAGYTGSIVAIAFGRTAGAVWLLQRFATSMDLRRWRLTRPMIIVPALFVPLALSFGLVVSVLRLLDAGDPRWMMIARLAVLASAYVLACLPIAWLMGLSAGERAWISARVRFAPEPAAPV